MTSPSAAIVSPASREKDIPCPQLVDDTLS